MIKAVIDTNVFISALFWKGKPNQIVKLAFLKKFIGVTSLPILEEVESKLLQKFNYSKEQTVKYLQLIVENFSIAQPKKKVFIVEDSTDNKIIEAAIEAKANYIVTGDNHLLKIGNYHKIKIIKPNEFLKKIK